MLTAAEHLQREWLNARCHLLELAAILDRVDQAGGAAVRQDPTYQRIQTLLQLVQTPPVGAPRTTALLGALSDPA